MSSSISENEHGKRSSFVSFIKAKKAANLETNIYIRLVQPAICLGTNNKVEYHILEFNSESLIIFIHCWLLCLFTPHATQGNYIHGLKSH